ncbi:unnamed protein product [Urochloa decumbens]|uniref:Uncharacterized protein n=1 Tax=Urochloa decumbens TaxID=240449 RepID=A0ABC8ZDS8_9POAL
MSATRCVKLLLLLTLIPLALRAASLLLAVPPPPSSSSHGQSPIRSRGATGTEATARAGVSAAGSAHGRRTTHRRRRTAEESAFDGGWFEDDKRLAPTGSNPLHNLR